MSVILALRKLRQRIKTSLGYNREMSQKSFGKENLSSYV
jgi:hypothetical protein